MRHTLHRILFSPVWTTMCLFNHISTLSSDFTTHSSITSRTLVSSFRQLNASVKRKMIKTTSRIGTKLLSQLITATHTGQQCKWGTLYIKSSFLLYGQHVSSVISPLCPMVLPHSEYWKFFCYAWDKAACGPPHQEHLYMLHTSFKNTISLLKCVYFFILCISLMCINLDYIKFKWRLASTSEPFILWLTPTYCNILSLVKSGLWQLP